MAKTTFRISDKKSLRYYLRTLMLDYIIVGQGIAGSLLSWFLLKKKQKVLVIDDYNVSSASNIAAGISNPITGKRLVKSWLADELLPFAEATYREFEKLLDAEFFHPLPIIKILDSVHAQNDWSVRCASPEYLTYLKNESIIYLNNGKVKNDFGGFEITGGFRLETEIFLSHYRDYLKRENSLLEEKFLFDELKIENEFIFYKNISARKIICCEGASAVQNPYFESFPFQLAKGECLIIEIEGFDSSQIINSQVLIVPLAQKNRYYIGATHEWHFDDALPSEKGKNELLENLTSVLKSPFKIIEHKAAIRPTVKDRRPFIGVHPEFPNVGIFNGMGTKGVSLAPFFARHFVEHLFFQKPLMKEVDIKRFL